ncbi:hypothetical protein KBT16_29765 [Nostoc sp. CCCryo 231-06]|nr:hypothetical protein [Nostoc sp. CCCryo 231-06]
MQVLTQVPLSPHPPFTGSAITNSVPSPKVELTAIANPNPVPLPTAFVVYKCSKIFCLTSIKSDCYISYPDEHEEQEWQEVFVYLLDNAEPCGDRIK